MKYLHYFNLNLAFEVLMENLELERLYNPDGRIIVESKEVFSYRLHTHSYYEMILYEPFDGCRSEEHTSELQSQ